MCTSHVRTWSSGHSPRAFPATAAARSPASQYCSTRHSAPSCSKWSTSSTCGTGGRGRGGWRGVVVGVEEGSGTGKAVGQAVGGGCRSGWGRLLSVTNAVEASTWRQGDSGWAWAGRPGGGGRGGYPPPLPVHPRPPPPPSPAWIGTTCVRRYTRTPGGNIPQATVPSPQPPPPPAPGDDYARAAATRPTRRADTRAQEPPK